MMRPDPLPPNGVLRVQSAEEIASLTIHVVTPMFGGADKAGKVDAARPVNAKSVRGHLRFWWRACKGATFTTAEELYQAESAIWGNTELPSTVNVQVQIVQPGNSITAGNLAPNLNAPLKYVLFPFDNTSTGIQNVVIKVTCSAASADIDKVRDDVKASLWAWVNFGGVGARTRRGCGSLWCENPEYGATTVQILLQQANIHVNNRENFNPSFPSLANAKICLNNTEQPIMDSWRTGVSCWKSFRQNPPFARNAGNGHPGASKWPEADSMRHMQNCPPLMPELAQALPLFPRADLGLPIIFQFHGHGRIPNQTMEGADVNGKRSRMSSPIIIRPLALNATNALPLVLLLNAPHVWDVDTPGVKINNRLINNGDLYQHGDKSCIVQPMYPRDAAYRCNTARLAFLRFLHTRHGFSMEVTL